MAIGVEDVSFTGAFALESTTTGATQGSIDPGLRIDISHDARDRVLASRAVVDAAIDSGTAVYGVTTGFGKLQDRAIGADDRLALQRNLVRSHACGVGPLLDAATARLLLLLRIQEFEQSL